MIFKKNSALLGLFLGFFIPIIVYVLQENIIPVIMGRGFSKQSMQLFALVVNVPFFRYYLIKLKYEDTKALSFIIKKKEILIYGICSQIIFAFLIVELFTFSDELVHFSEGLVTIYNNII